MASEMEQQEFDVLLQDEQAEQLLKTYWGRQWNEVLTEDKSAVQIPHEQQILEYILTKI